MKAIRILRRVELVAWALCALFACDCGASFVGPATQSNDPHEGWTDCHDGTWCPPAYPQCPPIIPGPRRPCEAWGPPFIVPEQASLPEAGTECDAAGDR